MKKLQLLCLLCVSCVWGCDNALTFDVETLCGETEIQNNQTLCSHGYIYVCKKTDNNVYNWVITDKKCELCNDEDKYECIDEQSFRYCESGQWKEQKCSSKCFMGKCVECIDKEEKYSNNDYGICVKSVCRDNIYELENPKDSEKFEGKSCVCENGQCKNSGECQNGNLVCTKDMDSAQDLFFYQNCKNGMRINTDKVCDPDNQCKDLQDKNCDYIENNNEEHSGDRGSRCFNDIYITQCEQNVSCTISENGNVCGVCLNGDTKCSDDKTTILKCTNGTWNSMIKECGQNSFCSDENSEPECVDNNDPVPVLCENGQTKCKDKKIVTTCVNNSWKKDECDDNQHCDESDGTASCVNDEVPGPNENSCTKENEGIIRCEPNYPKCSNEKWSPAPETETTLATSLCARCLYDENATGCELFDSANFHYKCLKVDNSIPAFKAEKCSNGCISKNCDSASTSLGKCIKDNYSCIGNVLTCVTDSDATGNAVVGIDAEFSADIDSGSSLCPFVDENNNYFCPNSSKEKTSIADVCKGANGDYYCFGGEGGLFINNEWTLLNERTTRIHSCCSSKKNSYGAATDFCDDTNCKYLCCNSNLKNNYKCDLDYSDAAVQCDGNKWRISEDNVTVINYQISSLSSMAFELKACGKNTASVNCALAFVFDCSSVPSGPNDSTFYDIETLDGWFSDPQLCLVFYGCDNLSQFQSLSEAYIYKSDDIAGTFFVYKISVNDYGYLVITTN